MNNSFSTTSTSNCTTAVGSDPLDDNSDSAPGPEATPAQPDSTAATPPTDNTPDITERTTEAPPQDDTPRADEASPAASPSAASEPMEGAGGSDGAEEAAAETTGDEGTLEDGDGPVLDPDDDFSLSSSSYEDESDVENDREALVR